MHVGAIIDGDSRTALSYTALILTAHTNKMPVTIYEELFVPCAREHDMPDELVTDKGADGTSPRMRYIARSGHPRWPIGTATSCPSLRAV